MGAINNEPTTVDNDDDRAATGVDEADQGGGHQVDDDEETSRDKDAGKINREDEDQCRSDRRTKLVHIIIIMFCPTGRRAEGGGRESGDLGWCKRRTPEGVQKIKPKEDGLGGGDWLPSVHAPIPRKTNRRLTIRSERRPAGGCQAKSSPRQV
ncbi:hypothetical protein pipiens_004740 [Culex pipiens pipiens]|uniref:Uncharacterized protein n=1 Tax=Culex pipiens pipiens TaxID=38569 RepID=A0ABD1CFD9_CULPP